MMLGVIFGLMSIGSLIFKNVRNILIKIIVAFSVFVSIVITVGVFDVSDVFKDSEPFLLTIDSLRENDHIVEKVGGNFRESLIVAGDLTENDAFFSFSIKGNGNKIKVYSHAEKKDDGGWQITKIEFE
jgi:hypothetical protein